MITRDRLKKTVKAKVTPEIPTKVDKLAKEAKEQTSIITVQVASLTIKSQEDYQLADSLLGEIRAKRAWWTNQVEPIIRPMRQALDAVYALNRTIDRPMEAAEASVKQIMASYTKEQLRLADEADRERRLQEDKLRRQEEELRQKAEAAKTYQMRAVLEKRRLEVQAKVEEIEEEEPAGLDLPEQTANSAIRTKPVWKLVDIKEVIRAVHEGSIPMEAVMLNTIWINRHFREAPADVYEWPGFKVEEDVIIAGR